MYYDKTIKNIKLKVGNLVLLRNEKDIRWKIDITIKDDKGKTQIVHKDRLKLFIK